MQTDCFGDENSSLHHFPRQYPDGNVLVIVGNMQEMKKGSKTTQVKVAKLPCSGLHRPAMRGEEHFHGSRICSYGVGRIWGRTMLKSVFVKEHRGHY